MKERDEDEETESIGSDLEQMVGMLERAEIDHDVEYQDDGEVLVRISEMGSMYFDEDGTLLRTYGE